jgi:hypothetical protein
MVPALYAGANDEKVVDLSLETIQVVDSYELDKPMSAMIAESTAIKNTKALSQQQLDAKALATQQTTAKTLGIDVNKVTKVEVINDQIRDATYTSYQIDGSNLIELDENNNIISLSTYDESTMSSGDEYKWKTTEKDYLATGEKVLKILGLEGKYELVTSEEFSTSYWVLAYKEKLSNGIINSYKGVSINVVRADASVGFLRVFDMDVNTEKAEITEEEALKKAQPIIDNLGEGAEVKKTTLMYERPNYAWDGSDKVKLANYVRLIYNINIVNEDEETGGNYEIHIDAVTGKVVGGGMGMDKGGAFGQRTGEGIAAPGNNFTRMVQRAGNFLSNRGFNVTQNASNSTALKGQIENFLYNEPTAYAFYFAGHGGYYSGIGDAIRAKQDASTPYYYIWTIKRTDIDANTGNWKFVFLDSCSTGTAAWTHAFNITNSSSKRVFLSWSNTIYSNYADAFNNQFLYLAGRYDRSLHKAAVDARADLGGTVSQLPIYFCGDQTYKL